MRTSVAANIEAHRTQILRQGERVGTLNARAARAMDNLLEVRWARCERDAQLLAAFSYRGVLARGFALVRDSAGHPLRTASAVGAGMPIEIEFSDGRIGARADGGASAEQRGVEAAKPRARRSGGPGQGDLF